jgi:uracil-DNA glycosylase family 4
LNRDQLNEHLKFAAELGVAGISRDPAWRRRTDNGGGADRRANASRGTEPVTSEAPEPAASPEAAAAIEAATPAADAGAHAVAVFTNPVEALASIRTDIGDCTRCKLHTLGRTQIVFGVGNPEADLMFVGEAPGGDEDIQGIPFVGRAGQLLTKIIEAIDLKREDVYIANVIKCRPPGNRNPEQDEVETCEPFLFRQIDVVRPKVIVALGTFAARTLLRTLDPISRLRGRVYEYRGARLIPTFHPAYLLRNPSSKREVWEDMKKVRELLKRNTTSSRE